MKKLFLITALVTQGMNVAPVRAQNYDGPVNRQEILLGTTDKLMKAISLPQAIQIDRSAGRLTELIFVAIDNYAQIDLIEVELGNGEVIRQGPMNLQQNDYFVMDLSHYGDYVRRVTITAQTSNLFGSRAKIEIRGK